VVPAVQGLVLSGREQVGREGIRESTALVLTTFKEALKDHEIVVRQEV
jgi:hypothetical protein